MEKQKIVVVDTDEDYITPLEYKFIAEWKDAADIEIITSLKYFNEFFGRPQNIYILIINEYLYSDKIRKQNCAYTFLLREEDNPSGYGEETGSFKNLYKYSSIVEIYSKISRTIRMSKTNRSVEKTQLYITYSVGGGCGKTVLSLALCQALYSLGRKVLYISGEEFQDFHCFLANTPPLCSSRFAYSLSTKSPAVSQECMSEIESAGFDFLRPMSQPLITCQISLEHYEYFLERLKISGMYDAIIFECPSYLSSESIRLFESADRVIVIGRQAPGIACKLRMFLESVSFDDDKFLFICNRYTAGSGQWMETVFAAGKGQISEYVQEQPGTLDVTMAAKLGLLQKTAYILE